MGVDTRDRLISLVTFAGFMKMFRSLGVMFLSAAIRRMTGFIFWIDWVKRIVLLYVIAFGVLEYT
ncbi:hypothetical protein V1520DRAFT_341721 [Lipomyces starkeyi]